MSQDKIVFQNTFLKKYSDSFERLGSEKKDFWEKILKSTSCRVEKIG